MHMRRTSEFENFAMKSRERFDAEIMKKLRKFQYFLNKYYILFNKIRTCILWLAVDAICPLLAPVDCLVCCIHVVKLQHCNW